MKCLDLTLSSPAENLALDEALLDAAECGAEGESLRFWESPHPFVVVGYGNAVRSEVNVPACASRGVPILRRCTGGGTVVQGPGCLNYSLVLAITPDGPLRSITTANQFIMEQNRRALETLLQRPVAVQGHTDLAVDNVKFSGNAQRRRKRFLLFHGSLLLAFDLSLITDLLPMPSKQPDYRLSRPHRDFLTNIALPEREVKGALQHAWKAHEPLMDWPKETVALLERDKYATEAWNFKF